MILCGIGPVQRERRNLYLSKMKGFPEGNPPGADHILVSYPDHHEVSDSAFGSLWLRHVAGYENNTNALISDWLA